MKVLVDANVWLSFLASPRSSSAAALVVRRLLLGNIELVLPPGLETEIRKVVSEKPYFARRISDQRIERFVALLNRLATVKPDLQSIERRWVRDPKDDYLVQTALQVDVDYLVTGDKDLLALGDEIEGLRIRSPQAFLDELGPVPSPHVD